MIAVLDTHILLWWLEGKKRLSVAQRRILERADDTHALGVSDVTFWEIALLVERGKVRLELPLDEWLARATAAPLVERCPMTPAIARELVTLSTTRDWDPADRILVATARVHGVPLVTSDGRIVDAGLVRTI
ncbi:MAG TPA: type II toxin-antitoxin system VapC family toxin [Labilithrix sp.]|jgi:PIN domain nuclease of toxin-antitoxin system|nr:type II toxin-antitoxin system VapC family toxin [Labilithrix sp.]